MTAATAASSNDKELGTLVVVVLKARNLPDKHTFTKQDPYAVVELGPCKVQTQIDKRGGQHPVWDQDLHVKVLEADTKKNRIMKVSCYAKEPKGDDLIGSGEVDITETLSTGEFDDWIKFETNGAYRGEIYLEMTFFAAGPPPSLARRPSKLEPSERLWRPAQTSPKGSAQPSPYNSPPGHYADLRPEYSTSPRPVHLAPQRHSRSQSPSSRNEPPLPSIPDEVPALLVPAANRASASGTAARPGGGAAHGKAASTDTSPKPESAGIPAALRAGGPSGLPRPTAQTQQQQPQRQRVSSLPSSSAPAYQSPLPAGNVQGPYYGPQPMPNGYGSAAVGPVPAQQAYHPPQNEYALHPAATPPAQPGYSAQHQQQHSYHAPAHQTSLPATNQPVYQAPHPPVSPANHTAYPPQNNYAPYSSGSPYPSTSPFPSNPSYDTPPIRFAASSPSPPTAQPPQAQQPMQFAFPEPNISAPGPGPGPGLSSYPPQGTNGNSNFFALYPGETEEERQRRLSTRYSSPMPLPPGVSPPPPPKSSSGHPANANANASGHTRVNSNPPVPPHSTTPTPTPIPASVPAPVSVPHTQSQSQSQSQTQTQTQTQHRPPSRVPDSYLERERAALARAQQEEADAELARRLAAECELEDSNNNNNNASSSSNSGAPPPPPPPSFKPPPTKSVVESDEEYARRLARELNEDVLEEARREGGGGEGGGRRVSGVGGGHGMPGGW